MWHYKHNRVDRPIESLIGLTLVHAIGSEVRNRVHQLRVVLELSLLKLVSTLSSLGQIERQRCTQHAEKCGDDRDF